MFIRFFTHNIRWSFAEYALTVKKYLFPTEAADSAQLTNIKLFLKRLCSIYIDLEDNMLNIFFTRAKISKTRNSCGVCRFAGCRLSINY